MDLSQYKSVGLAAREASMTEPGITPDGIIKAIRRQEIPGARQVLCDLCNHKVWLIPIKWRYQPRKRGPKKKTDIFYE